MRYEVIHGTPGNGPCKIAYHADIDLFVYYTGYYDAERGVWKLYSNPGTPEKYVRKGMILSAREVRWKRPPAAPAKKPEEKKQKPWWTLPDPEGQIDLLGGGAGN